MIYYHRLSISNCGDIFMNCFGLNKRYYLLQFALQMAWPCKCGCTDAGPVFDPSLQGRGDIKLPPTNCVPDSVIAPTLVYFTPTNGLASAKSTSYLYAFFLLPVVPGGYTVYRLKSTAQVAWWILFHTFQGNTLNLGILCATHSMFQNQVGILYATSNQN